MKFMKTYESVTVSKFTEHILNLVDGEIIPVDNLILDDLVFKRLVKWNEEYGYHTFNGEKSVKDIINQISVREYIKMIKKVGIVVFVRDYSNYVLLKKLKITNFDEFGNLFVIFLDNMSLTTTLKENNTKFVKYLQSEYPNYFQKFVKMNRKGL